MPVSLFRRPFFRAYHALWLLALPFLKRRPRLADGWHERLIPDDWLEKDPARVGGHGVDIWIQAASGGEARLAAAILSKFHAGTALRVLVTTWTRQGRDVLEDALPSLRESHPQLTVFVRFAPLDEPNIVKKAVSLASPRIMALLETELWPALMAACKEKSIPVHIFNGRINTSTAHFGNIFSSLMTEITPVSIHAISRYDQNMFAKIFPCGADIMPNIKFDMAANNLSLPLSQRILTLNDPVFLFASVRECEETRIPGQLAYLYAAVPNASVIIVPRHLHRVDTWKSVLEDLSFMPVLASELSPAHVLPRRRVLIWDHFGDLPSLYASAHAVFVGGSFGQGGQNFLEALSAGCVPCIGPSARNFLWAMGMGDSSMPSLEEAGLLHVAHTPREVIDIMIKEASSAQDKMSVRCKFQAWLAPRQGGAARAARLMEEAILS